jgi:hypothetical protein
MRSAGSFAVGRQFFGVLVQLFAANWLGAQALRITTSQYDNMRTGANIAETVLTPANVNAREFGKISSIPVDGDVYAQPLYLSHVDVPGKGSLNLLFVATEHDSIYAFDADGNSADPVWHSNLLPNKGVGSSPVQASDVQCPFISPQIGITATPVIDTNTGTLFVLTRTRTQGSFFGSTTFSQQLHALAITTGQEKFGGPVEIRASVPGTGEGSAAGQISFNALRENPRAALLLVSGAVYMSWASSCDVGPYHGWVMAYDARTLKQLATFNTSPDAGESGIWQSDTGPAADEDGNLYVSTGNGLFDVERSSGRDFGDTILKLRLQGSRLAVQDFFTPADHQELNSTDSDLGSGGPLLVPGKSGRGVAGLIFGGKQGLLYDVTPSRMGGLQSRARAAQVQSFRLSNGIYSAPAYWNGNLYTYASQDFVKQFAVIDGKVAPTYTSRSKDRSFFSGGTPTVSASKDRNGIVWIVETRAWNEGGTRAILRAYDARNVARQLYSSDENESRDQAATAVRFTIPMVANGRVYVGGVKSITVYGLLKR